MTRLTPADAGWIDLAFEVRRLTNRAWEGQTGDGEAVLVVLAGRCDVTSSRGEWHGVGRRATVFDGLPWAVFLPRQTSYSIRSAHGAEVALATAPTDRDHPARLIRPQDVSIEVRGGHNNTRQITHIVPPGFDCHRLVCCEVYTPSGNWSSYPPHKHDVHHVEADGEGRHTALLEADLEELYFYKFQAASPAGGKDGFALQRVYTDDGAVDAVFTAREDDIVTIPYGYHPVSAAYGYDCYYLNFLAGTAQSLAASDDPAHAWVRATWTAPDPRLPMVTLEKERAASGADEA